MKENKVEWKASNFYRGHAMSDEEFANLVIQTFEECEIEYSLGKGEIVFNGLREDDFLEGESDD